jgi:phosphomannomutase
MKNIVLFDMDGTLTKPRKVMESDIIPALRELAKHAEIGIVTGSDYDYVHQQIGMLLERSELRYRIHILPCNGTKYYPPPDSANNEYRLAHQVNMREKLGETHFRALVSYLLQRQHLMKLYDIPFTGHHIDYRGSMINWCPIGRNANDNDRKTFIDFDTRNNVSFRQEEIRGFKIRINKDMSIKDIVIKMGGDTSFDIFPTGWDKTYCLRHFPNHKHYFVGDRCEKTGNDWELYETLRGVGRGFKTTGPEQTSQIIFDKIIPAILSSEEDNG